MPISRTAWIDDDGTGTTGTIINNAEKTLLYDQIDLALGGIWANVAYTAGDFTAAPSGSWSVTSFTTFAYAITGKLMTVAFYTTGATIGGAPVSLDIKLPAGQVAARSFAAPFNYFAGGATGIGWALAGVGTPTIKLHRDILGTTWVAGTNYVTGVFLVNIA